MSDANDIVYAPAGNKAGQDIPIDMGYWARIEARLSEVATVTPTKAPELMASFNRAALDLDKLANSLELEAEIAERERDRIGAEILLDRAQAILEAKGIATSADLRKAVVAKDPEYLDACDRVDALKAMTKMIKGKLKAFERAFSAVKNMVGEKTFNFSGSKELSHGTSEGRTVGIGSPRPGFGTAKVG